MDSIALSNRLPVRNYVSDILAKLDTRDRTRAVLKAITLRII
ncbi:MAG: hypothetical protein ACXIUB_01280 [Wenzhouxiangella sp.]